MSAASKEPTPPREKLPPTPVIETPITNLKIVEQGDDDEIENQTTNAAIDEALDEIKEDEIIESNKSSPVKSPSEIPPPPEFANETIAPVAASFIEDNVVEKQQLKRTSRHESNENLNDERRPSVHQDVRRSISADDKSTSSASTSTIVPAAINNKLNTSTITINQLHDQSNSLASNNGTQVTIVTSHPPVIIDNSPTSTANKNKRLSKSLSYDTANTNTSSMSNEVIIVSNDTNKTKHVQEPSTDDDYQSYDSLENSPKYNNNNNNNAVIVNSKARPRKLDESEVLIVSPDSIFEDEIEDNNTSSNTINAVTNQNQFDTSHVSVVTVGDEQVKVKDSSHILIDGSNSDLSHHSELGDGIEFVTPHSKTNGQIIYNSKRSSSSREDDVNIIVRSGSASNTSNNNMMKKRISPDSSVDCSSSTTDSPTRAQSENGSMRSNNGLNQQSKQIIINNSNNNINNNNKNHHHTDRSDAESISTNASHDSRDDIEEGVQLRRKEPLQEIIEQQPQPKPEKKPARTKEEIQIANLKKKTRKRTRRFEIDGVQVTTTTSKVIYGDDENGRLYDDHIFRKQELRELKLLQKQEKKQFYELQAKEQIAKDQQDKKFEQERLALEKTYEADMDVLARQHKQTVEKYEQQQENELRNTSKKIRMEQERELKLVRNNN
jgi:STE20-like kinase